MGFFKSKSEVKIAQEDLNDAKLSSVSFEDETTKKRAFVDVLGARLAMKLLFTNKMEANNLYSMYTIQNILKRIDIADIYLNNLKIDVRLVFNENEIFIPKSHFEYNITPDIYFVLCFDNDLSSAGFIGFCEPNKIDKTNCNSDFYFIKKEDLSLPEDFKKYAKEFVKDENLITDADKDNAEESFMPFLDNELSKNAETNLIQTLSKSMDLREELVEFENFEEISEKIVKSDISKEDEFLNVIGAQMVAEDEVPEGMEEVTIDLNETEETSKDLINKENDEISAGEEPLKNETTQKENKGLSIIEGAAVAGGLAAAGTILSAGAAAAAESQKQSAKVAGTVASSAADTTLKASGEVLKNTADTINSALNNIKTDTKSSDESDFEQLLKDEKVSDDNTNIKDVDTKFENEKVDEDLEKIDDLPKIDFGETNDSENDATEKFEDLDDLVDFINKKENDTTTDENPINATENADLQGVETDNNQDVSGIAEQEQENNEEKISSSIPDPDFSDMTKDSENKENDETSDNVNVDENKDEISPMEQIEENPDALEEYTTKIKNSQMANMPDYFNNIQETDADENENSEQYTEKDSTEEEAQETETEGKIQTQNDDLNSQSVDSDSDIDSNIDDKNKETDELQTFENINEDLPELDINKLPELDNDETLVDINSFDEIPEEKTIDENAKEDKDDTVNLDNFDFEMFEKDVNESNENPENSEIIEPVKTPEETEAKEVQEISEPQKDIFENNNLQDTSESTEELSDYDNIVEHKDEEEIDNITSQVDAFLNDVNLNEAQKSILADEIDIDENLLNENDTKPSSTETQDNKENSEQNEIPETSLLENIDMDTLTNSDNNQLIQANETEDETASNSEAESLEVLFKQEGLNSAEDLDLGERTNNTAKFDRKKTIVAASVAGAIVVSLLTVGIIHSSQNKNITFPKTMNAQTIPDNPSNSPDSNSQPNAMTPNGTPGQEGNANIPAGIGTPSTQAINKSQDMGQAVSNAFSTQAINAQVSKIAWEVPEDLSYNASFRKYLQSAGKNLKLSLQNDLLLATEMAYSNRCVVDILLSNSGTAQNVSIITTSGSKQIDNIVLQSVKETLNYLKAPTNALNGKTADLTLIINF